MVRGILGSLLVLVGAAAAVWSPFRAWYGGRHGSDIRVDDLFTGVGVTPHDAALFGSLFLPMLFAAVLAVLGLVLRSRPVVAAAGVIVLGFTILWMVRQAQFSGSLTAGGDGLDTGVALAVAGGVLLLLAAWILPGRTRLHYGEPFVPPEPEGPHATAEPGGPAGPPQHPYDARPPYGSQSPYDAEPQDGSQPPYDAEPPYHPPGPPQDPPTAPR
jgi:hypothetical protein